MKRINNYLINTILNGQTEKGRRAYSYWKDGISLRTGKYRLTKFFREEEPTIELFDYFNDPEENINISNNRKKIVDSLMPFLNKNLPLFYLK